MQALVMAMFLAANPTADVAGLDTYPVRRAKAEPTRLKFEVQPGSVIIYVDGKKRGKANKRKIVKVRPGRHSVRLVNGKDETEFDLVVNKGKTLIVKYAFEDSGRAPDPVPGTPPDEDNANKPRPNDPGPDKDDPNSDIPD